MSFPGERSLTAEWPGLVVAVAQWSRAIQHLVSTQVQPSIPVEQRQPIDALNTRSTETSDSC